ncbi:HvfA family oxazolone/thioamide-modified RiPP metallophore [Pseudomonas sp. NCHU5208]|uniref:HvfA family oxazolone/thioamide-modified RiPP metallophore n=1 Tax=unclassified Pseudomonas TaxID=196821 RepID=UPI0023F967D8|nr:hypothetical protein [Pseudomonas sp. AA-38]
MKPLNTLTATLGAALLTSVAFTAQAASNPFAAQELSSGYSLAAGEKSQEGSCGEGKCGGEMKADKEGSCGAEKKAGAEGKCGGEKSE